MSERVTTGYKRLFEVRILHHYWLDEGAVIYDNLSEAVKTKKLLNYRLNGVVGIKPSPRTSSLLSGLKAIARQTSLGLVVVVPEDSPVPDDAQFVFTIEVEDTGFFRYTSFTLQDNKIVDCYSPGEDIIYRYKENVPVFSNLTGVPRGTGPGKQLFLSKEIPVPTATDKVEYLISSGGALLQLTGSQPGAGTIELSASAASMPVFYNQHDSPVVVAPQGLTGAPARGIQLTSEVPDNVFGIISISAVKPGDPDYSCTSGGIAKENYPVFQIRMKNRSVTWKYLNKNTGDLVSESTTPLPLTFSGNAGSKQKPSAGLIKADYEGGDPTGRIERIYTEIFE
ncbi:MAG: hypothetical protein V1775_09300 [Bacteroidota bacterium]